MDDFTVGRLASHASSFSGALVELQKLHPSVPLALALEGENAQRRFLEFFAVTIRNPNTRAAYLRATTEFFDWCEKRGVTELARVEPMLVAAFIEEQTRRKSAPSVKQQLAALRKLFDWLVIGQILPGNPATSVRGPTHHVSVGKTPVMEKEEARRLLETIPIYKEDGTPDLLGLRDRALLGLMVYSFARISALLQMRVEDYAPRGKRFWITLHEKGGKFHRVPVHHLAEEYLDAYLLAAGIADERKSPLWRSGRGRAGTLSASGLSRGDAFRIVRRRAQAAGLGPGLGCHSFRATGITAYLQNGGTLENAQEIAAHASPQTTRLYDRRREEIRLEEIERIRL